MTWLWIALGVLVLVVGLPLLIGACIPREHRASITRRYDSGPEEIWKAITGFEAMGEWREGVSEVVELEPVNGQRRIREHTRFGPMTYAIEAEEPPRRLVLRIADTDKGFGGTWTFEVRGKDGGSELQITEDGFVDNLFFRFMARFVFGYEKTLTVYQDSLRRKLGG
jgi:uncharacterized protein YndB with AHSA1/START domain